MAAPDTVVNLADKLAQFDERFAPRIVGQLNDLHVKVAKLEGEFVWHHHADTDEMFVVIDGEVTIELPDRAVRLGPGELFVVPRGVEHRPVVREGCCELMLIEPVGVDNSGSAGIRPDGTPGVEGEWI
jgi:mannose-6-phosphate isomerase-like protein (cupin superfamily)